ncbi:BSP-domain-containing protein [Westerdykella ornata]|uniref:BSP-domain-containing protein n=1 Tax=Westerdykella ornata TaxID=318751 RepID=A0A6A6JS49_WESOR|nr:BSP-domain-containing protein [Westerdykella ornata]KAF2279217.1 BSP-domain-containing protein [Westerdykella ornata]
MESPPTSTYFQTVSPAAEAPQPSALPPSTLPQPDPTRKDAGTSPSTDDPKVRPNRKPLLRLELRDLSCSGCRSFLRLLHASTALEDAVDTVLRLLYTGLKTHCIPSTRSVTLTLRAMGGVAYTTGLDIDSDHKEIHLNTSYIAMIPEGRLKEEMLGVIIHEMVHCWQHDGNGTAPGGLIEGIADWVRLKAGYAPPHWKRRADCDWDSGYEKTAYFLEWLEEEHGADIVRSINDGLRGCEYDEDTFWPKCCGKSVHKLWDDYKAHLSGPGEDERA